MEKAWALILENKPLYAAAIAWQLEQHGFHHIEVVNNHPQARRLLAHQRPSLMLINCELAGRPALLTAGIPLIRYALHDGSQLDGPPDPAWCKGALLSFPCPVEHFSQALMTAMGRHAYQPPAQLHPIPNSFPNTSLNCPLPEAIST